MSKVMTAALALSLLAGTSALAQSRDENGASSRWRSEERGQREERQAPPASPAPQAERAPEARPTPQPMGPAPGGRQRAPDGIGDGPRGDRWPDRAERTPQNPGRPDRPAPDNRGPSRDIPGQRPADTPNDNGYRGDRGSRDVPGQRPSDTPDGHGDRWDRNDRNGRTPQRGDDGRNEGPRARPGWSGDPNYARDRDRDQNRDREWNRDRGTYRGDQRPTWRDRDRGRNEWRQDQWRRSYQAQRRYHAPRWRPPAGFYFRTWSFGDYLPWGWYSQQYYVADYWRYGLPTPPIGCEWVRSGDDAILVDVWSGRVLSVYYDLFW